MAYKKIGVYASMSLGDIKDMEAYASPAAKEERRKANEAKMDILINAYRKAREQAQTPVITGSMPVSSFGKSIFDEFYANNTSFSVTSNPIKPNEFLLNARTPEELLSIAGFEKQKRKGLWGIYQNQYEPGYYEAATSLMDSVKRADLVGNSSFFINETKEPVTYDMARMMPEISNELARKYNILGGLQRGALRNETESIEDDELVLFQQDPALAMEAELQKIQGGFSQITKNINEEFTRYGQSTKKIGTYQTASLSEEQMFKKILQGIRETYTRFNGEAEEAYVGNKYAYTTPANFEFSEATPDTKRYLQEFPTLIKP